MSIRSIHPKKTQAFFCQKNYKILEQSQSYYQKIMKETSLKREENNRSQSLNSIKSALGELDVIDKMMDVQSLSCLSHLRCKVIYGDFSGLVIDIEGDFISGLHVKFLPSSDSQFIDLKNKLHINLKKIASMNIITIKVVNELD